MKATHEAIVWRHRRRRNHVISGRSRRRPPAGIRSALIDASSVRTDEFLAHLYYLYCLRRRRQRRQRRRIHLWTPATAASDAFFVHLSVNGAEDYNPFL